MIEKYKQPILKNLGLILSVMGILKIILITISLTKLKFIPILGILSVGDIYYNLSWTLGIGSYNQLLSLVPNILLAIMLIYAGKTYRYIPKSEDQLLDMGNIDDVLLHKMERRKNRLLKFILSTLFLVRISYLINSPISIINNFYRNFENLDTEISYFYRSFIGAQILSIYYLLISIIYAYILFKIVTWLSEGDKIILKERQTESGRVFRSKSHNSKIDRLTHRVIDFILAVLIFGPFIYHLTNSLSSFNLNMKDISWAFIAFPVFLFYFISEAAFKRTPTKYLTGTIVCDAKTYAKTSTSKILARTFARFIPFDAISFLGSEGWHDTFSETVLNRVDDGNNEEKNHWIWLLIFILLFIVFSWISINFPSTKYF